MIVAGPNVPIESQSDLLVRLSFDTPGSLGPLSALRYDRVLLHEFEAGQQVPAAILRDIFSRQITSIRRLVGAGAEISYRPFAHLKDRPSALVVFPGSPIPLDKGSNQRVFNLVYHLNTQGIATELLITTSRSSALPRLADLLTAIAPRVHTYRNNKPFLPWRLRTRREVERLLRLRSGQLRSAPDLFADRLATRASLDGCKKLSALVETGLYDTVIVNFAWMTGLLDAAKGSSPNAARWLCDTHDVQFLRGASLDRKELRWRVSQEEQKALELKALRKYDAVIAISQGDDSNLREQLGDKSVILAPSGFDYAQTEVSELADPLAPSFGFIGRAMQANQLALEKLLLDWWPSIQKVAPRSRLLVAGSICANSRMKSLLSESKNTEALGFVPTLGSFYSKIDVALNPVVVQGGLNFKSVEAVAAGCLLVTTPMGVRSLGEGAPVVVASSGKEVASALRDLMADPSTMRAQREQAQLWCTSNFGDEVAFRNLRGIVGG